MSTVNLDLYALWQRDRFVTSLTNPAPPSLPAIVAGDTWNISAFFVDDVTPMQIHRFAGAAVSARIRAAGNNHGYADAAASGEIPATTTPVITRTQTGSTTLPEIQSVSFPSIPTGGTFRIGFSGAGSGGRGGGYSLEGITAPLPVSATSGDIEHAIENIVGWYKGNDGPYDWQTLASRYGGTLTTPTVTGNVAAGFTIQFGSIYANAQWFNNSIHLVTIDDSALQYKWGWSISLPFTASDFTDYLLSANGPAYFEVMLNGNQAAFIQLTGNPGGGNAPAFTNGPPPNSGAVGSAYDFTYAASGYPAATFSLTSGSLPTGLTLTSAGRLSGTPTGAGTFSGVVTATNSNGTVTQAFSITIGGTGGGGPGPGGVPPLASYRNGNFNVLDYSDGPYLEDRDDEWPGLLIWHIPYCIDIDQYLATKPSVGSYEGPFGYFWKDTPFKYIGDGIVEFERLRHNIPGDANRKMSTSKNYQVALFNVQGGHVVDQSIDSFSRDIEATCNYHYNLDDPGVLQVVPIIQMIPYLRSQSMWDFGTGFPTGTIGGVPGLYTNNYAPSPLPGGSIDHILGRLFCRKLITG